MSRCALQKQNTEGVEMLHWVHYCDILQSAKIDVF